MKILRPRQKFQYIINVSSFYLLFLLLLAACKDSGTDPRDVEIVLPDGELTYVDHIQNLFQFKCASRGGCHSPYLQDDPPAGDLDLTQYSEIINHYVQGSVPLFISGQGENSFLYKILLDSYLSIPRMPYDGPPFLNSNQTDGVKRWIDGGAKFSN